METKSTSANDLREKIAMIQETIRINELCNPPYWDAMGIQEMQHRIESLYWEIEMLEPDEMYAIIDAPSSQFAFVLESTVAAILDGCNNGEIPWEIVATGWADDSREFVFQLADDDFLQLSIGQSLENESVNWWSMRFSNPRDTDAICVDVSPVPSPDRIVQSLLQMAIDTAPRPILHCELYAPNGALEFAIHRAMDALHMRLFPWHDEKSERVWGEMRRQNLLTVNGCPMALLNDASLAQLRRDVYNAFKE